MILQAEKLSRWYRQVIALNDVTLSIPKGITGLLGQNGAGKTSLLRMAVGLLRPSAGTLRVFGEDPWNRPDFSRRIGYAPEHDGFYEFLTGFEFVQTLLRMRGFPPREARERTDRALHRVGLTEHAHRRLYTYSRGMRQRTKIAQAIAHDPELLLLDEPLSGSDPLIRAQIIQLIRSLPAEGKSVIVSSHVLHEIEQLTRHIVLIHRGRLVADGDVHEIRGLIDRHPHTVRIRATRTRDLASKLAVQPDVTEITLTDESTLSVRTRKPDVFYQNLPATLLETGCVVEEIDSPDDNLEAVFRYLTEK